MRFLLASLLLLFCTAANAVELTGSAVQGGLIFGRAEPGSHVRLDGTGVAISEDGRFVVGFGRDETGVRVLEVTSPGGDIFRQDLQIQPSKYDIEVVEGLPPKMVTPDPESAARIREDARMVASAREHRDDHAWYASGFEWPARGRISGVYGSQRILNGQPRNPHYGLDIAAPVGTDVHAPADGLVTLAQPDLYYSGGTLIIDHGQGLSSTFLHLSEVLVETGTFVKQGDLVARIGATGRASGPHLDWRMNWLDQRVNPRPLVSGSPGPDSD